MVDAGPDTASRHTMLAVPNPTGTSPATASTAYSPTNVSTNPAKSSARKRDGSDSPALRRCATTPCTTLIHHAGANMYLNTANVVAVSVGGGACGPVRTAACGMNASGRNSSGKPWNAQCAYAQRSCVGGIAVSAALMSTTPAWAPS